jgi:hypothetical protein
MTKRGIRAAGLGIPVAISIALLSGSACGGRFDNFSTLAS